MGPTFRAGHTVLARGRADDRGHFNLPAPLVRWTYALQGATALQVVARAPGHGPGWGVVMPNTRDRRPPELEIRLPAERPLRTNRRHALCASRPCAMTTTRSGSNAINRCKESSPCSISALVGLRLMYQG